MAKSGPWEQVRGEVLIVLEPEFEDQKREAERPGHGAALDQPAAVPRLDEGETRAIDQAAGQQDHGVDRADGELSLLSARIETRRVPVAAIDPTQENRAEEQHFGREEQPHAGDRGPGLVAGAGVLELVRQTGFRHGAGRPRAADSCRADR